MKTNTIPYLDKPISKIICGTDWLNITVPNLAWDALDAYWAAGGRVFDTAFCYGRNTNLIASWANDQRVEREIIYFDKVGHPGWEGGKKSSRISRDAIRRELARNHDRLRQDTTDFLVLHRDDPSVPVGEIVEWLNELKDEGQIRVFGGSNWSHLRIAEANAYASANGKQGFSLNNPNLTLAQNTKPLWDDCLTIVEDGRAWHTESQLPLFAWSSTARGYFARTQDPEVIAAYDNPQSAARRDRAESWGKDHGLSATQVALAWTLNQPFPVFALCGLRTPDNVRENVAAADVVLTPEEARWLEHGD